jgi:hypothetical protein
MLEKGSDRVEPEGPYRWVLLRLAWLSASVAGSYAV